MAWGAKANKPHNVKKQTVFWPCRLRREGKTTTIFVKMCGFSALAPQDSKNILAEQPLRDPFEVKMS
jgi:hypothetical protein